VPCCAVMCCYHCAVLMTRSLNAEENLLVINRLHQVRAV
jgi:hypothetical protein